MNVKVKEAELSEREPVLIEQTRKKYKAIQLIGWIVVLPALVGGIYLDSWFVLAVAGIGLLAVLVGGILAWWHHS